ncbi:MAG: ATP-binding protein [Caldilineaceae bacterium]|nr:ATP-binding protein [Caldilineaceae bacterium]
MRNLETLRQPLEDKVVTISRASGSLTFPANFVAVCAMNPCPCGYYGDERKECTCSPSSVQRYQKRISGPIMDRMAPCAHCMSDIHLQVRRVPYEKPASLDGGESSAVIRGRVETARRIQAARFAGLGKAGMLVNGDMGPAEVQQFCSTDEAGRNLLRAGAYHRVLKPTRTIADLTGEEAIRTEHLAEALQYRPRGGVG